MNITLLSIKPSTRKNKRFVATFSIKNNNKFNLDIKNVHFGAKNGSTLIDHKDIKKRLNWMLRHKYSVERANYDPLSPAVLSWMILWNKPSLKESIEDYKEFYNF